MDDPREIKIKMWRRMTELLNLKVCTIFMINGVFIDDEERILC